MAGRRRRRISEKKSTRKPEVFTLDKVHRYAYVINSFISIWMNVCVFWGMYMILVFQKIESMANELID